jgi:C_GCAxxG_C_C family probable redox protein
MTPIDPKKIREEAESLYASGFCCSEGSLLAIARGLGIESPSIPAIASGFCGGMARTGGACGALTGAVMGLGLALGRNSTEQATQPASHATQRLVREFREIFGSADCHVLVGFDPNGERADINNAFNRDGRRARCSLMTGTATELAAQIIEESKQ